MQDLPGAISDSGRSFFRVADIATRLLVVAREGDAEAHGCPFQFVRLSFLSERLQELIGPFVDVAAAGQGEYPTLVTRSKRLGHRRDGKGMTPAQCQPLRCIAPPRVGPVHATT